jgi:hypothetical protein
MDRDVAADTRDVPFVERERLVRRAALTREGAPITSKRPEVCGR